jgi:hypothetical protein
VPDFEITSPDGKRFVVTAPEGASQEQVLAYAQQQFSSQKPAQAAPVQQAPEPIAQQPEAQQPNTWGQAIKNVGQGIAHAGTSFTGNLAGNIAGLGALGVNAMFPTRAGSPALDPAAIRDRVSAASTYVPENQDSLTMKVLQAPGKVIGGAGEFLRSGADKLDPSGTLGHVAAAIPQGAADYIGIKGTQLATAPKVPTPYKAPVKEVPTTPELRKAASDAYEAADKAGVVIKPESTRRVVTMMKSVAKTENLGKLPPMLKEAADILTERIKNNEPLTLMDADKVRQLINDAKKSKDPADIRLAKIMQEKYDTYLDNLGAGDVATGDAAKGLSLLKEARAQFQRRRRSELLDEIEKRADVTGDVNYTQAGQDLALRREYAKLAKNERQMKMFSAEEQAAIRQVARGGKKANILRNIGKMDPTRGGASAAINAGVGGVTGGAIGAMLGGPAGAGAGALTGQALLGAAANIANKGALRITRENIAKARETLVGRGLTGTARPAPAVQGTKAGKGKVVRGSKAQTASAVGFEQREARR